MEEFIILRIYIKIVEDYKCVFTAETKDIVMSGKQFFFTVGFIVIIKMKSGYRSFKVSKIKEI